MVPTRPWAGTSVSTDRPHGRRVKGERQHGSIGVGERNDAHRLPVQGVATQRPQRLRAPEDREQEGCGVAPDRVPGVCDRPRYSRAQGTRREVVVEAQARSPRASRRKLPARGSERSPSARSIQRRCARGRPIPIPCTTARACPLWPSTAGSWWTRAASRPRGQAASCAARDTRPRSRAERRRGVWKSAVGSSSPADDGRRIVSASKTAESATCSSPEGNKEIQCD